jgi:hypothetical protein
MDDDAADIVLSHDPSSRESHYRLDIDRNKIYISASSTPGFMLAFKTLRYLLPDEIDSMRHIASVEWTVPIMENVERYAFAY